MTKRSDRSGDWGVGSNFYPHGTTERVTETGGMILIIVKEEVRSTG